MTQQHPITPPPELVQQWAKSSPIQPNDENWAYELYIAHQAAQWGADMELEACCELTMANDGYDAALALRADRRPKPPSLKEQALEALDSCSCDEADSWKLIRRALQQLPDHE